MIFYFLISREGGQGHAPEHEQWLYVYFIYM